jgi:hypothetical protein
MARKAARRIRTAFELRQALHGEGWDLIKTRRPEVAHRGRWIRDYTRDSEYRELARIELADTDELAAATVELTGTLATEARVTTRRAVA